MLGIFQPGIKIYFTENAERPHVLELSPENLTIYEGSSAMFRCQAVSNIHADFRWFRKHDNLTNMQVIIYENNPYEVFKLFYDLAFNQLHLIIAHL